MANYKRKTTLSVLWVAIERLGQQFLQVIVSIVLARFIAPEAFGLVALLVVLFTVSQTLIESGLGEALIREPKVDDKDISTVFWYNLIISIIAYIILFFASPLFANFYNLPELIPMTKVMGLSIIFFGLSSVNKAELTRNLNFKKQAIAQLPAIVISGVIAVIMAVYDYGVWAIIANYLLISIGTSLAIWIVNPIKIKFIFSKASFSKLFAFGNKLLISNFIGIIFLHIYTIVIGKLYPANILGYYSQAQKIQRLSSNNLANVIQKATYPILVQVQNDGRSLKDGYKKIIMASSIIIFPLLISLFIFSDSIITLLLGDNWLQSSYYFKYLIIAGMMYHLNSINLNILKVKGRSDLFLQLEIIKKLVVTLALVIGIFYGIQGILIGQAITPIIAFIINSYYTEKFINYSIKEQIVDILGVLLLTLPMIIIGLVLNYYLKVDDLFTLTICLLVIVSSYIFVLLKSKGQSSLIAKEIVGPLIKKIIK